MKIDNSKNSSFSRNNVNRVQESNNNVYNKSKTSFYGHLQEIQQQEIRERVDKLFKIIEKQGQKLKESLDKKDLLSYKKSVKEFLRLIQKEYAATKQSFSWDRTGNFRTFTLTEKVDQNLEILHNLFMKEQADVLTIVKKIDEIRGLLMDLYI